MSECGHERIGSMYNGSLKARIGDTWASMMRMQDGDDYDTSQTAALLGMEPKDHNYIKILDKWLPNKDLKILEIGAGDGSCTRMFVDYGYKNITGITIGNKNVDRGKNIYGLDLLYMDMHFTSFPNKSFDAIIGFETFEHTPAPLLLCLEFMRLLKKGGKVVMEAPYGKWHNPMNNNPHHVNVMDGWQGKAILMSSGFVNVQSEESEKSPAPDGSEVSSMVFYGEKTGDGDHQNHFNDIVNGKFLK